MKKVIQTCVIFFTSYISFAQTDTVNLSPFLQLPKLDTILIDYCNLGCRFNSGDKTFIFIKKDSIVQLTFHDFYKKIVLDGNELKDPEKKMIFLMQENMYEQKVISEQEFKNLIQKYESAINSFITSKDKLKAAGESSYFFIKRKNISLERNFEHWIEINTINLK